MSELRIALFASGNGSNCRAIHQAIEEKKLHASIGLVLSNNAEAGVLTWAEDKKLPWIHLSSEQFDEKKKFNDTLIGTLQQHRIELIVLAGYMKKIGLPLIEAFPNRILNIHPALLPAFGGKGMYGEHVHQAVIDYGAKITGITVHLVDPEYDHGAIVLQKSLDVLDSDTPHSLAERVLALEHQSYHQAIELFAQNRITIKGRKVLVS